MDRHLGLRIALTIVVLGLATVAAFEDVIDPGGWKLEFRGVRVLEREGGDVDSD